MYDLSFSEEFFTGNGDCDMYEMPESQHPTNVLQAAISLDRETKLRIAQDVFGWDNKAAEFFVDSESFGFEVVDKVRETDLCDGLSSPVTVYIDPEQNYSLTIYDDY